MCPCADSDRRIQARNHNARRPDGAREDAVRIGDRLLLAARSTRQPSNCRPSASLEAPRVQGATRVPVRRSGIFANFFRKLRTIHRTRSEEHTSELQSQSNLVCRLLLEKTKQI